MSCIKYNISPAGAMATRVTPNHKIPSSILGSGNKILLKRGPPEDEVFYFANVGYVHESGTHR